MLAQNKNGPLTQASSLQKTISYDIFSFLVYMIRR